MPTRTTCHQCGTEAHVKFIKLLGIVTKPDGASEPASRWTNVIDCPKCGTREQDSGGHVIPQLPYRTIDGK